MYSALRFSTAAFLSLVVDKGRTFFIPQKIILEKLIATYAAETPEDTTNVFLSNSTYLFVDADIYTEFAVSKNNPLTLRIKDASDDFQSIDSLKKKAKSHIDTNRRIHRKDSSNSLLKFWLLGVLIVLPLFRLFNRQMNSSATTAGA
ncbi:MAG: hypothetical protein V4676_12035 [Bacteroidota bacterium]